MAVYIYLTTNDNRREPIALNDKSYIHVKASQDGSQTIILIEENISDPNLTLKTLDEAHTILNQWIDLDNEDAPLDAEGNQIVSGYISLGGYFE